MIFLRFVTFVAIVAVAFIDVAQALPAQLESSPSYVVQPGTLLGKRYTLHYRTDSAPDSFSGLETQSQLDGISTDGPISRATRFELSQRKKAIRGLLENDTARRENLLSNVHPEPISTPLQTSTTASPTQNKSVTLVPHPTSANRGVKAGSKAHRHTAHTNKKLDKD